MNNINLISVLGGADERRLVVGYHLRNVALWAALIALGFWAQGDAVRWAVVIMTYFFAAASDSVFCTHGVAAMLACQHNRENETELTAIRLIKLSFIPTSGLIATFVTGGHLAAVAFFGAAVVFFIWTAKKANDKARAFIDGFPAFPAGTLDEIVKEAYREQA